MFKAGDRVLLSKMPTVEGNYGPTGLYWNKDMGFFRNKEAVIKYIRNKGFIRLSGPPGISEWVFMSDWLESLEQKQLLFSFMES